MNLCKAHGMYVLLLVSCSAVLTAMQLCSAIASARSKPGLRTRPSAALSQPSSDCTRPPAPILSTSSSPAATVGCASLL